MKIECLICGKAVARIGNHIGVHNITIDDYRTTFPGIKTCAYKHSALTIQKMQGERPAAKGVPKSEQHRKKLSEWRKGRTFAPHSPDTIKKMREAWVRRKADKETYATYVQTLSERMSTPEMIAAVRNRTAQLIKIGNHNGKSSNTKPELKMKAYLDANNIVYEQQYILMTDKGSWTFDFYLPEKNMLVEIDSLYYHTKSLEVANRDRMKEELAINQGYVVARISDKNWNPSIIHADSANIRASSSALRELHHSMIMARLTI